jgi:acyl CoA:acetate/3-ketoacid CoA transferase alpha subunit
MLSGSGRRPVVCTLPELAARVRDGESVVAGGLPLWRKPLALLDAVVRQGTTGLRFSSFLASLDAELLASGGALAELEYGYVGRDLLGLSRSLSTATGFVRRSRTELEYWAAVRAGAAGLPALPDALGRPVPAARYDHCVLHASHADDDGHVYADPLDLMEEDDALLAASADDVLVTVERLGGRASPSAYRLLDASQVTALAHAPGGAAPLGMAGAYPPALDALTAARPA